MTVILSILLSMFVVSIVTANKYSIFKKSQKRRSSRFTDEDTLTANYSGIVEESFVDNISQGDKQHIQYSFSRHLQAAANVVIQADTTTLASSMVLLGTLIFLAVIALDSAEGPLRYFIVGATVLIVLVSLFLASSLERTRGVQGNRIEKTAVSPLKRKEKQYDVFISAPIVIGRDQIITIKQQLNYVCGLQNIFYASSDKVSKSEFDNNSVALSENFNKLLDSRIHILVYPAEDSSSTFVEVGMALALGLPSFWFVKQGVKLPFLLEQAWRTPSKTSNIPRIFVYKYNDIDDIVEHISELKDIIRAERDY